MNKEDFSLIVKLKRKELQLTQHEFAELIGVNWVTVWRWENQKQTPNETIMSLWASNIEGIK